MSFCLVPGSKGLSLLVSAQGKMENMLYAEELVREFLVFRGFTNTLQAFVKELGTDTGKGFQVDKILDLIFSIYVPKFQAESLFELLRFLKQCFSSLETQLNSIISDLDVSIIRYYIIHAIQAGRKDKVIELFDIHGSELLQKDQEWASWFAIPYIKAPQSEPQFRVYFSKEWSNALHLSLRNFLSKMFNDTHILEYILSHFIIPCYCLDILLLIMHINFKNLPY
ncbi:hypothetical protein FXO38_22397 [Capsicum annuum]